MRIIGGTLSGRTFEAPSGRTTRPMLDRIRQALFNIIEHHDWGNGIGDPLAGANVMDAFCGTGALAFEALSRGAAKATLFDNDRNALQNRDGQYRQTWSQRPLPHFADRYAASAESFL